MREQIAAAKSTRSEEIDKLRAELRASRAENAELRKKLHESRLKAKREHARAEELETQATETRTATTAATAAAEAELKRLRSRLSQAESVAENARRAAREGRNADETRLRVLLDALTDAAKGLRDEIGLPTGITRPADSVGAVTPERPVPYAPGPRPGRQRPRVAGPAAGTTSGTPGHRRLQRDEDRLR